MESRRRSALQPPVAMPGRSWPARPLLPLAAALLVLTAACSGAQRQAAPEGPTWPACTENPTESKVCVADASLARVIVANGSTVAFASGQVPAGPITVLDTCWSEGLDTEASSCTSAGLRPPPGLATVTTVDGYPAIAFDTGLVPDPSGEAPEGLPPLPAYVDVQFDAGGSMATVRVEVACCTKLQ